MTDFNKSQLNNFDEKFSLLNKAYFKIDLIKLHVLQWLLVVAICHVFLPIDLA